MTTPLPHPDTLESKKRNQTNETVQPETHTRLNEQDQQLVNEFIGSGVNRKERKPFRPWVMMMWLTLCIVVLGVAARMIGLLLNPY